MYDTPEINDKVRSRIRNAIGEILTDAELTALVAKSVEAFTTERQVPRYPGSRDTEAKPSEFHTIVTEELAVLARERVRAKLSEMGGSIMFGMDEAMEGFVKNNLGSIVWGMLHHALGTHLQNATYSINVVDPR